jgi:hypothetical protein
MDPNPDGPPADAPPVEKLALVRCGVLVWVGAAFEVPNKRLLRVRLRVSAEALRG